MKPFYSGNSQAWAYEQTFEEREAQREIEEEEKNLWLCTECGHMKPQVEIKRNGCCDVCALHGEIK